MNNDERLRELLSELVTVLREGNVSYTDESIPIGERVAAAEAAGDREAASALKAVWGMQLHAEANEQNSAMALLPAQTVGTDDGEVLFAQAPESVREELMRSAWEAHQAISDRVYAEHADRQLAWEAGAAERAERGKAIREQRYLDGIRARMGD